MLSLLAGIIGESTLKWFEFISKQPILTKFYFKENNLTSTASEAYDIVFYDPDGQPVILNDEELSFFEDCNRIQGGGSLQGIR